jgi:hypothetical protein
LSTKPFTGDIPFYKARQRSPMRYIEQFNKTAKPFRWAYADPTRRIA